MIGQGIRAGAGIDDMRFAGRVVPIKIVRANHAVGGLERFGAGKVCRGRMKILPEGPGNFVLRSHAQANSGQPGDTNHGQFFFCQHNI